ncbi:MAG: sulfatase-like hydrolase/transferase [Anaerolineae bacterium]|nr:sulfatase-like hydrolase/transferase [Anaerolineae bacterium]
MKPNILLIILDTLRRDRLSTYGHNRETSPAFDDFSTRATLFERAVAPAQWTVPAHSSIFTGLYPSLHGVTQSNSRLSGMHPTLAEILHGSGYHTVGFCNNPLVGVLDNGLQRGFDSFYNYAGATVNRPSTRPPGPARRYLSQRWRRFAHPVQNRFAQSDWLFRTSLNPLFVPLWTRFVNYTGHTENSISDLIDYWQAYQGEQPLFAFLNLMGAHLPYRPPQDYLQQVAPETQKNRHAYRFMSRFNAEAARWASPTDPPLADWEQQTLHDFYDAEIRYQDAHLNRLLAYLKQSGALENTLVIIAADHGESHGDHNYIGHTFVVYQELVHVPLLIHYPDHFPAGKRVQTNISTRRIFHTVLDIAGIHQPPLDQADPNADIQGLSLARSTNGAADTEGGVAFSEAFPPATFLSVLEHRQPELIERLSLRQVRRGVYDGANKLVMVGERSEGLFDVAQDPAETQDITSHHPDVVQRLQGKLTDFIRTNGEQQANTFDADDSVLDNLRALGYIE